MKMICKARYQENCFMFYQNFCGRLEKVKDFRNSKLRNKMLVQFDKPITLLVHSVSCDLLQIYSFV